MPTPPPAAPDRAGTPWAVSALAVLTLAVVARSPARGQMPDAPPARQVTLFGVIATPNDPRVDPKLVKVEAQLRKLLPDHGFRLLGVQSKRLTAGQTLTCHLGDGLTAATTLVLPDDGNGKVRLDCAVLRNRAVVLESLVTTPPNQLFFCDKMLGDGSHLLVGIGAR